MQADELEKSGAVGMPEGGQERTLGQIPWQTPDVDLVGALNI